MKLHVDATKCDGYGTCVEIAPELIELDEWGFAYVAGDGEVPDDKSGLARDVVAGCPRDAITLSD